MMENMEQCVTLLVIDDEPVARAVVTALLTAEGYNVVQARNGREGLALAAQQVPDAILLDVMMPGMDGFEVCRRLRADPRLGLVPILMITALDDQESRVEGISAGADDFITKPYDSLELAARLRTIARLNRYRRLLAQQACFEWIVEQAAEGYVILDGRGEIHYANPQARLYLDLPDDPEGQNFLDAAGRHYHCQPEVAWQNWPAPITEGARFLVRPESDSARAFWLEVVRTQGLMGDSAEHLVRLRDVTEQVQVGQNIRSFQALVSHKLRTPLIGWLSGLDLLVFEAESRGDAELFELSQVALAGAKRFDADVSAILQYVDAENQIGVPGSLPVSSLAALSRQMADELHIEVFSFHLAPEVESWSLPFGRQIMELISREILSNACKFHPQNRPQVRMAAMAVAPGSHDGAQCWLRLQITDDGVTLGPEQLANAWSPYYQGEKWFTGQSAGLGLGLALVASLVWSQGGTYRLYNRSDGPGVVVEIDLPSLIQERGS
jgi:two-component system cell cycle response regulator